MFNITKTINYEIGTHAAKTDTDIAVLESDHEKQTDEYSDRVN